MTKKLSQEELKQIAAHFSKGPKKSAPRRAAITPSRKQSSGKEPQKAKPQMTMRLDPPNRKKQLETINETTPDTKVDTIKTSMNAILEARAKKAEVQV